MAQPTNAIETYDVVGNREGLIDAIYMTNTAETPVLSAIGRTKAIATMHEWQTEDIGSATTNYVAEGDDAAAESFVATGRLSNYCQILDKVAVVTGTQEAVSHAGNGASMAKQLSLRSLRLKKDMEFAILDNNAKVAGAGDDTTAREMAGLPAYIVSNVDINGSTGPNLGTGLTAWSGGTDVALTEGRMKNVIQQAWNEGGSPDMILCTAFNKQVISGFSGNGTRYISADANKLMTAYDIYASDFG